MTDPKSGLTAQESLVMDALVTAWGQFVILPGTDDDLADFRRAIHECQRILALRVTRREYPSYWRQAFGGVE
jgi:hypothetical protein